MKWLLTWSAHMDRLSEWLGRIIQWLVMAAVVISAGNAIVRKAFSMSSNSLLEIQWYLFAAVFMLGAGYVLHRNEHVRIDFVSARLSPRVNAVIDIAGLLLCVAPFCLLLIYLSWPLAVQAWVSGEMSQNAGGLVRWPIYALMPVGFGLLLLQVLSELVKRVAFLTGHRDAPTSEPAKPQGEDEGLAAPR